ncbi:hypothetical protein EYF80_061347 [Liparis tanakae]|uniref:Uncharacterized protein n=1 Tax=Liparis tanakae TaxID=230148 RepID=A0A4Z2EIB4_9TELE|nr:hypothetical protein EYF80_061347 [Liparis tanakae]
MEMFSRRRRRRRPPSSLAVCAAQTIEAGTKPPCPGAASFSDVGATVGNLDVCGRGEDGEHQNECSGNRVTHQAERRSTPAEPNLPGAASQAAGLSSSIGPR